MEEYAVILLRKIITPFTSGFVDLQSPAGILNSVIVYNYDGNVYASDESRMLAEHNDYTFRIGKITESYEDLFYGTKAKQLAKEKGKEYKMDNVEKARISLMEEKENDRFRNVYWNYRINFFF